MQAAPDAEITSGCLRENRLHESSAPPWAPPRYTGRDFDCRNWRFLSPLVPGQIIGVGRNFARDEASRPSTPPELPILFYKPRHALLDPGAPVVLPPGVQQIKFESELAVVIGRRTRSVSETEALAHVAGYTIANDYAALDLFHADGHWTLGKACDTFCPLGPVLTTEIDFSSVRVQAYKNGVLKQDSPLGLMINPVPRLIALISRYLTLEPGDVILTGTPFGAEMVGAGDTVECVIPGIGRLRNPIQAAA